MKIKMIFTRGSQTGKPYGGISSRDGICFKITGHPKTLAIVFGQILKEEIIKYKIIDYFSKVLETIVKKL